MDWFNYYGLIAVIIILIPNIIAAITDKASFENKVKNKFLLVTEQIGRYGCMLFMTFNVPHTYIGLWFNEALTVYLAVGGALLIMYCLGWIVFRKSKSLAKMLWLSVAPTILFLFCGITLCSAPLIICSVLFGIGHITISCLNTENGKNTIQENITTKKETE